jgi:mono/diheme cytochrome c family protein
MKGVLTDFPKQFAALKNESTYADRLAKKKKDEPAAVIDVDEGGMAEWSKENGPTLLKPENAEDLNALVEFLVAQGARTHAEYDPKLVARGKEIFETGKLKVGEISSCTNCHDLKADKPFAEAEESPDSAPSLTGYGSAAWLKAFINNPGGHLQYPSSNTMPAYDKVLTPEEIDLLVRWMVGNYYKP